MKDKHNPKQNAGYCFLWMKSRAGAEAVVAGLNLKHCIPDPTGRQSAPLVVRHARLEPPVNKQGPGSGNSACSTSSTVSLEPISLLDLAPAGSAGLLLNSMHSLKSVYDVFGMVDGIGKKQSNGSAQSCTSVNQSKAVHGDLDSAFQHARQKLQLSALGGSQLQQSSLGWTGVDSSIMGNSNMMSAMHACNLGPGCGFDISALISSLQAQQASQQMPGAQHGSAAPMLCDVGQLLAPMSSLPGGRNAGGPRSGSKLVAGNTHGFDVTGSTYGACTIGTVPATSNDVHTSLDHLGLHNSGQTYMSGSSGQAYSCLHMQQGGIGGLQAPA